MRTNIGIGDGAVRRTEARFGDSAFDDERAADRRKAALLTALTGYALDVPMGEVRTGRRGRAVAAFARQAAMYLAHVVFEMSLARVAAAFGRDRSTVAHACHAVEDRRDEAQFDAWIDALERAAQAAPEAVMTDDGVAS